MSELPRPFEDDAGRRTGEALAEVARLLVQSLDPQVVAQRIVDTILTLLGALSATVYRLEPHSGDLEAVAFSGDLGPPPGRKLVLPGETGAVGVAVRERRVVVTPDVLTDPGVTFTPEVKARVAQATHRSVLAVPLLFKERVIGAFAVGDRSGKTFADEEIRLLQAFADEAAIAFENAQLYEEAERRRREAEIVAELAKDINASLDLGVILHRVAERAMELCGSDLARIALRDPDSDAVITRYAVGSRYEGYDTIRIEAGKGVGGQVLLTGRPFRTDHYAEDPRITKDYLAVTREEGVVAELAVPIRIRDRVEGLLFVHNRAPRPFTDRDEAVLLRLADHAAIAIQNVRLLAREQAARAEAEAAERRFRNLVHGLDAIVWAADPTTWQLTFVSRRAEQMLGYPVKRWLTKRDFWAKIIHPEDLERALEFRRTATAEGRDREFEYRVVAADGRTVWLHDVVHVVKDPEDHPLQLRGLTVDVTARKQTEVALTKQVRLAALTGDVGIALSQSETLREMLGRCADILVRHLDAALARIWTLNEDQIVLELQASAGMYTDLDGLHSRVPMGQSTIGLIAQDRQPHLTNAVIDDPRADDREWTKREGIVAFAGYPLIVEDRLVGVMAMFRRTPIPDATLQTMATVAKGIAVGIVRKQVEEDRRALLAREQAARAEAEAANRAKDEFLAMLSHELRNPIGAISNAVAVLEYERPRDEQSGRLYGIIARQTQQLSRLLDDLLDLARLAAGKVVLRREPVEFQGVAERCVDAFRQFGRTAQHTLSLSTDPVTVVGDPARLEQIVSNLLENAVKYTPPGGRVHVAVEADGAYAVLRVRDTGVGIERAMLARIFDLFTQGARALDRSGGGLGIGLTVVRRLVQLHGGTVEAFSAGLGHGSEFIVRLPRSTADFAPPARPGPAPAARPLRILIVEDDGDARTTLRKLLELRGHEVEDAADGISGVAKALGSCPDVAVIDIGLPGLDGYTMARQVRTALAGERMFLIALTGYGEIQDRRLTRDAGFDAHLVKPVKLEELYELLGRAARATEDTPDGPRAVDDAGAPRETDES